MLHSLENAIPKEWKEVLVHESIDYKEDNYETLYNKFTHLSNVFRITYGMLIQGTANIKIYGRRWIDRGMDVEKFKLENYRWAFTELKKCTRVNIETSDMGVTGQNFTTIELREWQIKDFSLCSLCNREDE